MSLVWYLLWFVVAVGLLVTVHEFGHFWVARRLGFKVLRFSVGFGRPLLTRVAGPDRVEYVLAAIPLGGYVKMLDEREGPVDPADLPRNARAYLSALEEMIGAQISAVGVGPRRDQTIQLGPVA